LETHLRSGGLAFAAKTLLRVGIVLLGLRLNFAVLAYSGTEVVAFDLLMVILGVALIMFVLRRAGFEPNLATLAAVGSSICGASAIAAAAPAIRANKESSVLAIVVCTLIGTIATFLVIPLQSIAVWLPRSTEFWPEQPCTSKAKVKPASSAGVVITANGLKKARLQQSGKKTRLRAHLRAATRLKQGQRDRRSP
jgi:hypothetical protein